MTCHHDELHWSSSYFQLFKGLLALWIRLESLGTEATQTLYRRSTLLAILYLVSCLSLLFAINGINDFRVEWTTRLPAPQIWGVTEGSLRCSDDWWLIWLKISFLLPVLQSWFRDLAEASIRMSTRIPKFLRCAGVFVCPQCPASRRPVISQLDSETVAPMKNTVYSRLIRSVLYK